MPLKPVPMLEEPFYPPKPRKALHDRLLSGFAMTALTSATLLLSACSGSQSEGDTIAPPGEPPITEMDQYSGPPGAPPVMVMDQDAGPPPDEIRTPGEAPMTSPDTVEPEEEPRLPGEPPSNVADETK